MLDGNPDYPHQMVWEDADAVAFLARRPTLRGYVIVAPRRHVEQVVGELDLGEYLALQTVIYRVACAVVAVVPTERLYLLSLGSQQGNAHVHWHVASLPAGVPYGEQQYYALMAEHGVFDPTPTEQSELATALRQHIADHSLEPPSEYRAAERHTLPPVPP